MSTTTYAVIDLETTDKVVSEKNYTFPEVIEIGAVFLNKEFEYVGEWQSKVQPVALENITPKIVSIIKRPKRHFITGKYFSEVADTLQQQVEEPSRVKFIHWGGDDFSILKHEYWRAQRSWPFSHVSINLQSHYFLSAMQGKFPVTFSLSRACKNLDIERKAEHEALADARDTFKVLQKLFSFETKKEEKKNFFLFEN